MPRYTNFDKIKATELNLQGTSDTEIARILETHQTIISRWRRYNNIPIRRKCWACSNIFIAKGGQATHCGLCGKRKCSRCKEIKLTGEFSTNKATPDGVNNVCKSCIVIRHRPRRRRYTLRTRWGLSPEEFIQLWEDQDRQCAICLEPLDPEKVDIDHDSTHCQRGCRTCIRGLTHHGCNVGLGFFKENPEALRRAADYLESGARQARHSRPAPPKLS